MSAKAFYRQCLKSIRNTQHPNVISTRIKSLLLAHPNSAKSTSFKESLESLQTLIKVQDPSNGLATRQASVNTQKTSHSKSWLPGFH